MNSLTEIIILGHRGFIGRNLLDHFTRYFRETKISGISKAEIDLTNKHCASDLASRLTNETTLVVCSAIPKWTADSVDSYFANLSIITNVLKALEKQKIRQLVFFSSAAVYGEEQSNLKISETTKTTPVTYYGHAKFASEALLKHWNKLNGATKILILRPSLVYGIDNDSDHYLPRRFAEKIINHQPIELWGDGSEIRNFISIDDVSIIVQNMIEANLEGTFNISSPFNLSYRELIEILGSQLNLKPQITLRERSRPQVDLAFAPPSVSAYLGDRSFTSPTAALSAIIRVLTSKN